MVNMNVNQSTKPVIGPSRSVPIYQYVNGNSLKRKVSTTATNEELQAARRELPVYKVGEEILQKFRSHQTIIVIGETGSGKTTQIPQIIVDSNLYKYDSKPDQNNYGRAICCTQPRRISAQSIAARVAEERGVAVGREVGYSVRFDDKSNSHDTKIRYMTDGMLVRESAADPLFKRYATIILDEVHERTINTDILLTQLRSAQNRRNRSDFNGYPLKLIIMSATMDVDNFMKFFTHPQSGSQPPVLYIEGRQFQIDSFYLKANPDDYVSSTVAAIAQIHQSGLPPSESILAFLTGQDEIEATIKKLKQLFGHDELWLLPLYAALNPHQQMLVFDKPKKSSMRKVVIATNIAETSITVPDIKHVVDAGKVKQKNHKGGVDMLEVQDISQAQAWQRAGRTGRQSSGKVYRLYSEDHFDTLASQTIPEIQRVSISSVVLHLYRMGKSTEQVLAFPFIDPPRKDMYGKAVAELEALGAVKDGYITEVGKKMSEFPVEPVLSRALLYGHEYGTMVEVLVIVACLSVDQILRKPNSAMDEETIRKLQEAHGKFLKPKGDAISFYEIYKSYHALRNDQKRQRTFCQENFLMFQNLKQAAQIRQHLRKIAQNQKLNFESSQRDDLSVAQKVIALAFKSNLAELSYEDDSTYVAKRAGGERKQVTKIEALKPHPSSALAVLKLKPRLMVYFDILKTNDNWLRICTPVEEEWYSQHQTSTSIKK